MYVDSAHPSKAGRKDKTQNTVFIYSFLISVLGFFSGISGVLFFTMAENLGLLGEHFVVQSCFSPSQGIVGGFLFLPCWLVQTDNLKANGYVTNILGTALLPYTTTLFQWAIASGLGAWNFWWNYMHFAQG